LHISELDYNLPEHLIAQHPTTERDKCRLLVYDRSKDEISHKYFKDIIAYLNKDDVLIFNDTKVFPARFFGIKRDTGAKIEFLILKRIDSVKWESLVKPAKRIKIGTVVDILDKNNKKTEFSVLVSDKFDNGIVKIEFNKVLEFDDFYKFGFVPLPPYIKRVPDDDFDTRYYQTVYAVNYGAVAAPTAGFHFTDSLIETLKTKGIKIGFLTLHIGWDTFAPVKEEIVEEHKMHKEFVFIPEETVNLVNNRKGRCIAVGTTVVRALESAAVSDGKIAPIKKYVDTFILPDTKIKTVDALITNFHLPKSTLLLLVSAFTGLEKLKKIYSEAINLEYRFFSYGDAMLII